MAGRYQVQERFAPWGREGQRRVSRATVAVVGLGALGGTAALLLARAGVGRLVLIDPDLPELENLHRQLLYTERDVMAGRPKVEAAAAHLLAGNRTVRVETHAVSLDGQNASRLLAGVEVVVDGLDRPRPRYQLNRICLEQGIPWVHAGVVGARGQLLVVRPGRGPCLQCWFPPRGEPSESVATHGIIGPLPACLASLEATEVLKLLVGAEDALLRGLLLVELWPPRFRVVEKAWQPEQCPVCGELFVSAQRA